MPISKIEDAIKDIKKGKMVILVDDQDRENEGDLIISAEFATPEAINFMATHGRGLICLSVDNNKAKKLDLSPVKSPSDDNLDSTAFTVSIDAKKDVTTGISAHDRSKTAMMVADDSSVADDFDRPGHMFPLIARDGGILVRAGHTEASVDISRIAGLKPCAVICEIMNDDGSMARVPDLIPYAKKHALNIGTIQDLIAYRIKNDLLIKKIPEKQHQIKNIYSDVFEFNVFENTIDGLHHATLHIGDLSNQGSVMTRVHPVQGFDAVSYTHLTLPTICSV